MSVVRVFAARRIHTMNASVPEATHLAMRDGRILGVGSEEDMAAFGPAEVDDRFRDKVLLPGFVEGHSHAFEGMAWRDPYLGYFDRRGPDGTVWPGLTGIAAVVARLQAAERELAPGEACCGWGFDPIYFGGGRMVRADLDAVSSERPVVITHASGHIMNVNVVALARAGFTRETELDGLVRDAAGEPTGELLGPDAMGRVRRTTQGASLARELDAESVRRFGQIACAAGVTTATDLQNELSAAQVAVFQAVTAEAGFPIRLVPALAGRAYSAEPGIARWRELCRASTERLRFGPVKLTVDGSIQGFTARLRWPGYHDGSPNGLWYLAPAELDAIVLAYHRAGAQLHIHTNGDEATEAAVDAIERALVAHPQADHRHTLQHCQMADAALFRRMAALGIGVNLFANHVWFWGDAHVARTMGPSRAQRLDACGTALAAGVPLAMHSDAPITPMAPLFTAWCAVNRRTAGGRVLGEAERIPVAAALRAITLGAAASLKLDRWAGSLDVGKWADATVLDEDPFEVAPEALRDVPVHATVVGGEVYRA